MLSEAREFILAEQMRMVHVQSVARRTHFTPTDFLELKMLYAPDIICPKTEIYKVSKNQYDPPSPS